MNKVSHLVSAGSLGIYTHISLDMKGTNHSKNLIKHKLTFVNYL